MAGKQQVRLYLASQSPRRAELLQQVGIGFERLSIDVAETLRENELPTDYVSRLAVSKAKAGWQQVVDQGLPILPVLGSDTSVVLANEIMGKPRDRHHGLDMLRRLSGNTHQVMSAVCLCMDDLQHVAINTTQVRFRKITEQELADYWQTGEPVDKAGGYGIQGKGAIFVDAINGSYSSVVGLPLAETWQLLLAIEQAGKQIVDNV